MSKSEHKERRFLACLKCGHTINYNDDMRELSARTCMKRDCKGLMWHQSAFRFGAWKLRTGQTQPTVVGHLDKGTLTRRMLRSQLGATS